MNPKDKNGNVLNVGDRVVYMKGTRDEDFGVRRFVGGVRFLGEEGAGERECSGRGEGRK